MGVSEGSALGVVVETEEMPSLLTDRETDDLTPSAELGDEEERANLAAGRRRFTWAAVIGVGITTVPFTWILWSLWGPVDPLRRTEYQASFFDLQARAMLHGKLSLPNGSLGVEGFIHDGKTYTYFGLFPSIIRMPVFLVTSSLDSKLTSISMLLAWFLTALFASMLLWRVRLLVRGDVALGRIEATGYGVLVAAFMGGTIWMLLAATPYVFDEDIAWSICLTIGSMFALLCVLERPTWARVGASGVLILCANLDRATTGWGCVVGAGLVALWFFLGFGGAENRRWALPMVAAGLIPLIISSAVNYAKFGVPFGVPVTDQVYTQVNAYRRQFLAANHNSEVGTNFVLTNIATYLRPGGLSLSGVFPYVTSPTGPPTPIHGVLFDRLYRTSSVPASTPLLFLLSIWGLVAAFRPRKVGRVALTRPLLLAAGSAAAALMLWGYIAPRYLGDFVPFLILASSVAVADIFRRLDGRRRFVRLGTLGAITVLALFSIAANLGMAIVPNEEWTTTQVLNYVQAQKAVSDLTGHPLSSRVVHGNSLPTWGPAGELYVVGKCSGLYISNGEQYWADSQHQFERATWQTVALGQPFQHTFRVTLREAKAGMATQAQLVRSGPYTVSLTAKPVSPGWATWQFSLQGGGQTVKGHTLVAATGAPHFAVVTTDPMKHAFKAGMDGGAFMTTTMAGPGQNSIHVLSNDSSSTSLRAKTVPTPTPPICTSLVH